MDYAHVELAADVRSVGAARRVLTDLLAEAGADNWLDIATLALSELVTNSVVHTGATVTVDAWATKAGVRVEVRDLSPNLPVQRHYATTSGTGRGLHLVDDSVDRWGAEHVPTGKVVWFELGDPGVSPSAPPDSGPMPAEQRVSVTLRSFPLLMHWAWQEHAQALLREYLLLTLTSDPEALDKHAQASDALTVLYDQVPVPELPDDPDELLADAIEPDVTADELRVSVPLSSVPHFSTLDRLLTNASKAASRRSILAPPTQPEIGEMREWICGEVARQVAQDSPPTPWSTRTAVRAPLADEAALRAQYQDLLTEEEAILATDEASIIVAASPSVVDFLGYASESELLGRRIIVVVPHRYHQAHIAGTTLNATNGRHNLLDVPLTVPVVRADRSEVSVELRVTSRRLDSEHGVFIASFTLPTSRVSPA